MAQEIASLYAKIGADTSDFDKGIKESHSALTSFGSMLGTGLVAAAALGTAAIVGIGAVIGKGISAAAGFEQSFADIAAVMGKTTAEIEPLKKLIMDLGLDPNLKVSTDEAAQAVAMLVKNGLTMTDVLNGAARSTVLLANATGADFGVAADIATDIMQQFNISAADMDTAVNGILGVTQASKFSIDDYRLAVGQAGGVASSVGVEFDDFNAALAATAFNFTGGSDAGTSFKQFLSTITPTSKPAIDSMTELGLITADGANQFYDAAGNMKSMSDMASILQNATMGLTEEQKKLAFQTIFGNDASRTAYALAKVGGEEIARLKGVIGNTDAEAAAATRMDTLSGQWEIFMGVIEATSIQIGEAFLPAAKKIVEWSQGMAEKYLPSVVAWFGKFGAWITESLPTIEAYITKLGGWAQAFIDWATGSGESLDVVSTAASGMGAKVGEAFGALIAWVQAKLPDWIKTLAGWGNAAGNWIKDTGWPLLLANLQIWAANLWAWIVAQYPTWVSNLKQWGVAAGAWITDTGWPALLANLTKWGAQLGGWLRDNLPNFIRWLAEWAVQLGAWVIEGIAMCINELARGADRVRSWLNSTGRDKVEGGIFSWVGPLWEWVMTELWPKLKPALGMLFDAVVNIIASSAELIWSAFWALFRAIPQRILDGLAAGFKEKWANFASWWVDGWTDFMGLVGDLGKIARGWVDNIIDGFKRGVADRWEGFKQFWRDAWQNFVEIPQNIFGIHSPSTVFQGFGINVMEGFADGIGVGTPLVQRAMEGMTKVVETTVAGMYDKLNAATAEIALRAKAAGIAAAEMANVKSEAAAQGAAAYNNSQVTAYYAEIAANQAAANQLNSYSTQDQQRAVDFLAAMQDPKFAADVGQKFNLTIGEINVGGTGSNTQDILSALQFLTTTYYSYGY